MAKRHTRTQQTSDDDTAQEAEARKRWVNNLFGYWHVCGARVCKRKRGCAGDPDACFERWWWMTPEGPKVQFRAFIKASCAGLSPQDALREADAEVARAAEHIASIDAQTLAEVRKRDAAKAARRDPAPALGEAAPHPSDCVGHLLPPSGRSRPSSTGYGEKEERRRGPRVRAL